MGKTSYPRPATDLFPEMLKLSPKQAEVLATLQEFPQGARAADIAEKLGMHVNTARGHLDELTAKDAVRVTTAPAAGRGRPSLIFQVRVPDNHTIAEEYIGLIEVLVDMLKDSEISEDALDRARSIGMQWAKKLGTHSEEWVTTQDALSTLNQRLREMGFDPEVIKSPADSPAEIALNACPFVSKAGDKPAPFICAVHDGFLQERSTNHNNDRVRLELQPYTPTDTCKVRVIAATD